jgi:molybdopterin-guanine dinucleotide biosynthesis protein A
MNFSAVILAGGRSSRMGRDKAFLSFKEEPLIQRALRVVREAGADEVLISAREGQDFSDYDCPVVIDSRAGEGPLTGIEGVLECAAHPFLFVQAVDLPHMTAAFIRWLAGHCGSDQGAVPQWAGGLEPLAAFYPVAALPILRDLRAGNRRAAREFAAQCLRAHLAVPVEVPPSYGSCFTNWNRPEDIHS